MKDQNGSIRDLREPMLGGQDIPRFGNYDLVHRIAVGGMGEVYLARQRTAFGREVAVKIIRSDLVHDVTARQRFLREAEVNAYLKHDHILPLVEFGEEQGRLFLVTPYIKGGTLLKRLQTGPLSLAEVHQLFTALVEAVAYLHKRGVIHRDLKPSNILLDREEDRDRVYVRLIDFGIATLQGLAASAPLTVAGHEMGTVAYMAPERLSGVAAPSNDIYSLGVILYQMITRQLPQVGEMVSLPQPLDYVIGHCLVADPGKRFTSVDELLTSFERAHNLTKNVCDVNKPLAIPDSSPSLPPEVKPLPPKSTPPPTKDFAVSSASNNPTIVQADKRTTRETPSSSSAQLQKATLENSANLVMPRPEIILPPLTGKGEAFKGEDYNAPTSFLDAPSLRGDEPGSFKKPSLVSSKGGNRQSRLFTVPIGILVLTLIILLVAGGLGYQAFQASISANITVSPRVQTISTVFTLTARPGIKSIDAASSSIPASALTSTQTGSQQGQTTGATNCVLGFLNCQRAVSPSDVQTLSSQLEPTLHSKIDQDLQNQMHNTNATKVSSTVYSNETVTSNPVIGTVSKTVTVTMTEQGSVEYIKAKDADDLALLLLKKKLNQHYELIDLLTQVGQPVVQQVNPDGTVQIAIAADGVARYQMPASELTDIQNHIKGLTPEDARAQIARDGNIDPNSIGIHLSYGNTIPTNVQQIKIEAINPSNPPKVQLTPIPTAQGVR